MSCLFNSLSYYTPNTNHQTLRNTIIDYIASNPEFEIGTAEYAIYHDSGKSLAEYVNYMRNSSSWGGAIEIMAYAKVFKTNVIVRVINTGMKIEFVGDLTTKECIKLRWTGNHYEPDLNS